MAMREFEVDNKKVYIDDEIEENETDCLLEDKKDDLFDTKKIEVINDEDLLSNTITNIFGDENE